jgi:hypothetical protein
MAYTWMTVANAFKKDETHPEGLDYQSAGELLRRVVETGQGRAYTDPDGNLVYESRYHRTA